MFRNKSEANDTHMEHCSLSCDLMRTHNIILLEHIKKGYSTAPPPSRTTHLRENLCICKHIYRITHQPAEYRLRENIHSCSTSCAVNLLPRWYNREKYFEANWQKKNLVWTKGLKTGPDVVSVCSSCVIINCNYMAYLAQVSENIYIGF